VINFDAGQACTAAWMGVSVSEMNRVHDDIHRALCAWLGITSHSMRDAAGEHLTPDEKSLADLEEAAVLHVQRLLHRTGAQVP
jgi:hypothetical protein